jgi:hypothetical protein
MRAGVYALCGVIAPHYRGMSSDFSGISSLMLSQQQAVL